MTALPQPRKRTLARRDVIELIHERGLHALLGDFSTYLLARGVDLGSAARSLFGRKRIWKALRHVEHDTPPELVERLDLVTELGTPEGHEKILALLREAGASEPDFAEPPYAFAARMLVDHPDLCRRARSRVEAASATSWCEYLVPPGALLTVADVHDKADVFSSEVAAWATSKSRVPFREVDVFEDGPRLVLDLLHADAAASRAIVTPDLQCRHESYVPARNVQIVVDRATRRLMVNAKYPAEAEHFRRVMGRIFHGSAAHYVSKDVVSLEPILSMGSRAFDTAGVDDVRRVRLTALHVASPATDRRCQFTTTHRNLADDLDVLLGFGAPTYAKLTLDLRVQRRAVHVELRPPNKSAYNREDAAVECIVRDFLIDRGFVRPPMTHALPSVVRAPASFHADEPDAVPESA